MPIHEYECKECAITEEIKIRINDPIPVILSCKKCDRKMYKKWTPIGFTIKGYNAKNNYDKTTEGWGDLHTVR